MHEEAKKRLADAEKSCVFFLKTFTEASTARVSKERFYEVMDDLKIALTSEKCRKEHSHPLRVPIFIRVDDQGFMAVYMDFRIDKLMCSFNPAPTGTDAVDRILTTMLTMLQPASMQVTDLEDLEAAGVKPYMMIEYMRDRLNQVGFTEELAKMTQAPAEA